MAKSPNRPRRPASKPAAFRPQVHVRMYCQGLGDCFLLRFEPKKGDLFTVLIDCGIYKASPDAGVIVNAIVDDIVETTKTTRHKNGHLDLMVVTHEHWDHISGFSQALDKFKAMDVSEVWQAWTEDENDPVAADLLRKYKRVKARLVGAMRGLEKQPHAAGRSLDEAFQIMSFFGVDKNGDEDDAYAAIKKMIAEKKQVRYRAPGEVHRLGKTGVSVFVLGPPKDVVQIGKDDPGAKDGYHKQKSAFFDGMAAMLGAIEASEFSDGQADRTGNPFRERQEISIDSARETDFFRQMYGFDDPQHPEAFRSIDNLVAETLGHQALRLDSHLNNISLVMAFRLPNGRVLLFPGDAQAGNWKSWAALDAPLGFREPKIDAHDLLSEMVFYKTDHGSHNVTPRTYGLELMTHPELRAVVPVDHVIAVAAGYGEMPLVEIMNALTERTKGVFARSDQVEDAPPVFTRSKKNLQITTKNRGEAVRTADVLRNVVRPGLTTLPWPVQSNRRCPTQARRDSAIGCPSTPV